jgi:hypothetical protein
MALLFFRLPLVLPGAEAGKVSDEAVDALSDVGLFEKGLAQIGIVHELLGDGVGHDGGLVGAIEKGADLGDDLIGESEEEVLDGFAEPPGLTDRFRFREGNGIEGADARVGIRFLREPFFVADPAHSVEEEVGTPVALLAGSPDQSDRSDGSGAGAGIGGLFAREACDSEEAVAFEGFGEHFAVADLEDVKGKGAVWKESAIRQEDCTDLIGYCEGRHEGGD